MRLLGDEADSLCRQRRGAGSRPPPPSRLPPAEPVAACRAGCRLPSRLPLPSRFAAGRAEPVAAEPAAAAPLPNYDELSVASLRARLRNLDVAQVRQLAEYERAHAARADVLTMFERRIAKLEAEA